MSYLNLALAALAGLGILYLLAATFLVGRHFRIPPAAALAAYPPVTVIKPLHGHEVGLLERLRTFAAQDYPAPVQIVFGTRDPADPALEAVKELRREFPAADVAVVVDARRWGSNNKVSNLLNIYPQARHDLLVFSDSDVEVGPDFLRRLVDHLSQPQVGLVSFLYVGDPLPGYWPRLFAAAINYDFLPGVIFSVALRIAQPCLGPTLALRRSTLEAAGGLEPFCHLLAEDWALGVAVRRLGLRVEIPAVTIGHSCPEQTLRRLVTHQLRWNRTICAVDPWGYAGSILMHPFGFALAALAAAPASRLAWTAVAASWAALALLQFRMNAQLRIRERDLLLIPVREVLAVLLFAATYLSPRVTWRGTDFRLDGTGRIHPLPDPGAGAPPPPSA